MLGPPPTVSVQIPNGRDYAMLLQQTNTVYNQLLDDKCAKLVNALVARKNEYDSQCLKLERQDKQKAMEYGVAAQESLNRCQYQADQELKALHQDYQAKLSNMFKQLEEKWRQEHKNMV